jgi:signal peptidase I
MSSVRNGFVELVKTVVYALLIAAVFRTLLFQPFWIPSGSMKPTLLIGDFLFVNKFAYGYSRWSCPFGLCPISGRILARMPERGDVIVFRHPTTGEEYIKRLIGLPGDRVQVKAGLLHINGEAVTIGPAPNFVEPWVVLGVQSSASLPDCINRPKTAGDACEARQAVERLPNGVSHAILDIRESGPDNTPEYLVPEGHFFFMGDNRDNSLDSRVSREAGGVGFVPFENLIGRADRVIFSSAGASLLAFWDWRRDRFFRAVH